MLLLVARQEVTKKRAKTFPLGTPLVRAKTVDAPRHQCFCENGQFQILRSHFEVKMRTRKMHASRKATVFAICYAPLFAQIP
jgi:hypothetical protein